MGIEAVLFDIDGTLVDSNDLHVLAWEEAFARFGVHLERDAIHEQIGKGSDMLVPALLPDSDDADAERYGDAHDDVFKSRYIDEVRAFPDAHALLARVHEAGQKVVLASSASQSDLDRYLDLLDARDLVSVTTSADDVEHSKPAPDIFATALKKLAPLTADDVMVVGDTPYDIEAAARCGIRTIAVRSGKFSDEVLLEAGAVALYDDVAALSRGYDESPLADAG